MFLHANGVGTARAVRIYKTYGSDAVQVMTENPYRLTRDVRGIGFKTADAIAMRLGFEKTALIRLRAGVSFALAEAMDEGHCGLPTVELVTLAESLLEAPADLITTALDLERSEGAVFADRVGETDCVFLAGLYRAEQAIADRLIRIRGRKASLARDRCGQSRRLGRGGQRPQTRRQPARRDPAGAGQQGARHHRRARGRQDHDRQLDPAHSRRQGRQDAALRPDRSRGQTDDRSDGIGGQDDSSAARSRSQNRRLQAQRGQLPRLRPPGRGRGVDGRRPAHAGAAEGGARPGGARHRRRHRPAAVGRPRAGSRGRHRVGNRAGRAPHGSLPSGGREPDHRQRPPDQPGADAGSGAAYRRQRFLFALIANSVER